MVIFHSYVSLPEGSPTEHYDFWMMQNSKQTKEGNSMVIWGI
jgi:hypothetical protein